MTSTMLNRPQLRPGERFMGGEEKNYYLTVVIRRYDIPARWGVHRLWPVFSGGWDKEKETLAEFVRQHPAAELFGELTRWVDQTIGLATAKPEVEPYRHADGVVSKAVVLNNDVMSSELRRAIVHQCCPIEWHAQMDAGDADVWARVEVWG